MPIVTNNGAVVVTPDTVDTADVVYVGGIAVRKSNGAMYVASSPTGAGSQLVTSTTDGNGNLLINAVTPQLLTHVLLGDSIPAQNFAPQNMGAGTVTSTGTTCNVNMAAHGLAVGQQCIIQLATQSAYNGAWQVASVVDANNFTVTLDSTPSASPATSATNVQVCHEGYFSNAGFFTYSRGRAMRTYNCGLGGDTVAGVLARIPSQVARYSPRLVTLLIGINDLNGGATAAATYSGIVSIVRALNALNAKVVVCSVLPLDAAHTNFATSMPKIRALNRLLRAYCLTNTSTIFADTNGAMTDPQQADGRCIANATGDTLHPSPRGAKLVNVAVDAAYASLGVPLAGLVATNGDSNRSDSTSANVASNPLFITTGGTNGTGATGAPAGVAQDWRTQNSGSATSVATLVARTVASDGDTVGNNQKVVITSALNGDTSSIVSFTAWASQFAAGDVLEGEATVKISSATALSYFYSYLSTNVGGNAYTLAFMATGTGSFLDTFPVTVTVKLPRFIVPSGTITGFNFYFQCGFSGAGGATMEVGRAALWKV